jgi:aminoglycoside phosphotransferase family enzyme/predicted kinase
MISGGADDQSAVIRFLMTPESYGHRPRGVERIDTHGAIVFLAGERAYKLKRAVKLAYLDFSTVERRREVCERELALNRRTAPQLYLGILPIRRDEGGGLRLGGDSEIVDWVIEMRRFDQTQLFDSVAAAGELSAALLEKLALAIERFHAGAPQSPECRWVESLAEVVENVAHALTDQAFGRHDLEGAAPALRRAMENSRDLLAERRDAGLVRRCHGDLHLKNIVLLDGEPSLFDALEFDDDLATIDVLYDLGFLLMDLWHRDLKDEANALLNHYVARETSAIEWSGLALLPLFLSLRAGVRAMVGLDQLKLAGDTGQDGLREDLLSYAVLARDLILPPEPRLIAIGGMSGTGKTTVARALAARIGPAPGAIHLRSDVERKAMYGAKPVQPLGEDAYAPDVSLAVYERLTAKAGAILRARHAVILDATFLRPEYREPLETLARSLGIGFQPVWLRADADQMIRRVTARRGDASDADAEIVRRQIHDDCEAPPGWTVADAGGDVEATIKRVAQSIGV